MQLLNIVWINPCHESYVGELCWRSHLRHNWYQLYTSVLLPLQFLYCYMWCFMCFSDAAVCGKRRQITAHFCKICFVGKHFMNLTSLHHRLLFKRRRSPRVLSDNSKMKSNLIWSDLMMGLWCGTFFTLLVDVLHNRFYGRQINSGHLPVWKTNT